LPPATPPMIGLGDFPRIAVTKLLALTAVLWIVD
jgi:hypothetical protein